jgi:hypothetical protein
VREGEHVSYLVNGTNFVRDDLLQTRPDLAMMDDRIVGRHDVAYEERVGTLQKLKKYLSSCLAVDGTDLPRGAWLLTMNLMIDCILEPCSFPRVTKRKRSGM